MAAENENLRSGYALSPIFIFELQPKLSAKPKCRTLVLWWLHYIRGAVYLFLDDSGNRLQYREAHTGEGGCCFLKDF